MNLHWMPECWASGCGDKKMLLQKCMIDTIYVVLLGKKMFDDRRVGGNFSLSTI